MVYDICLKVQRVYIQIYVIFYNSVIKTFQELKKCKL